LSINNEPLGNRQKARPNRQVRKVGSPNLPALAMLFWSKLVEFSRNWSKNSPFLPPPGQARPSVCELQAPTLNHVSRRSFRAKADHAAFRICQRTSPKAAFSPAASFAHWTI